MLLTPDMKLIHAIYQRGDLKGYYEARSLGVRAEIFMFSDAQDIWKLIEKMSAKGRLPSPPEVENITSHDISEICPDPLDVAMCAEVIVKHGLTRQLHDKLGPLVEDESINDDPFGTRDKLAEILSETAWSYGDPYSLSSNASLDELAEAYEQAALRGGKLLGLSSPWPIIDSASLGLQDGELSVIFAKRKQGKSWLTIAWALHIWNNDLKPDEKVLFVTMEMTPLQVIRRMACIELRVGWDDFRGGRLTSSEKKIFDGWVESRRKMIEGDPNIIIVGANQVRTVKDLAAVTGEHKPRAVIVDSFYILGRSSGRSIYERVLGNVQELKLDIALKYEVPVLASTQLKGTTDKDVLMADSDDAMGAKAIGDYADATYGIFSDEDLKNANQRLLRGMEAREFLPKGIRMHFDFTCMNFSQIEEVKGDFRKKGKKGGGKGKRTGGGPGRPMPPAASGTDDEEDGDFEI